jgi:lysyl-tRNA synthetase class 2
MAQQDAETQDPEISLSDIRQQRLKKLTDLVEAGIDPYGSRVEDIDGTSDARASFENSPDEEPVITVTLAGRLTAKRDMGKSCFVDVKDQQGRMQVYAQKNALGDESFAVFKSLDMGDIVTVTGHLFKTRTGEITVRADSYRILSKSLRPLPEKWHGLTDQQQRYRQRYLDLISNDDSRDIFLKRVKIISRMRRFLEDRGYLEVETPMLQNIPGGATARPFETHYNALSTNMYMRIAPELFLKRLLVGGLNKVFEINRNFRNEGMDRNHNPEFTAVEIYEAFGDCRSMMELVEDMLTTIAQDVMGNLQLQRPDGDAISLERPWRRVTFNELLEEKMGANWYALDLETRRDKARDLNLDIPVEATALEVDTEVYDKTIEGTLVQPTFVTRLPKSLVPLAKHCSDNPELVDVFELVINGQEIAPGYSELNDPVEQRRRFETQLAEAHGEAALEVSGKIDEDFLTALEHGMPPAGGMGIGIDRLVMFMTGAPSIRDVILFPQLKPQN